MLLVALLLLLLFFRRRRRVHKQQKEKPVDLLLADEGDEGNRHQRNELPQYYEPEPFVVPDPTIASSESQRPGGSEGRRLSSRSGTPDLLSNSGGPSSTTTRKGGAPRPLRPVNIIQHDDAGPSEGPKEEEGEPETIELPPAYTNIRRQEAARAETASAAATTAEV